MRIAFGKDSSDFNVEQSLSQSIHPSFLRCRTSTSDLKAAQNPFLSSISVQFRIFKFIEFRIGESRNEAHFSSKLQLILFKSFLSPQVPSGDPNLMTNWGFVKITSLINQLLFKRMHFELAFPLSKHKNSFDEPLNSPVIHWTVVNSMHHRSSYRLA